MLLRRFIRRNPTIAAGAILLAVVALAAVAAPWIAGDPMALSPIDRLLSPSPAHWFGTDSLGRDVYTRAIFGARISLTVGVSVAVASVLIGLAIGLAAGYWY